MPIGRIIKGVGGLYSVDLFEEKEIYLCQARGKFRIDGITPLVGDIVDISFNYENSEIDNNNANTLDKSKKYGYLMNIHERKNKLIRPKAANIDLVAVVFAAAKPAVNPDLLDSFLLTAEYQVKNIEIIICINKIDIDSGIENGCISENLKQIYEKAGYKLFMVSAEKSIGMDGLKEALKGKTSIVAGPSGVGKSSILNALSPGINLQTGAISRKIERGKHTTRHAELYRLNEYENTYIGDSPGFSSLSVDIIPKNELQHCFAEFRPYLGKCYFTNCSHISEPDCAVKEQIGKTIDNMRYERYIKYFKAKNS